MEIQLCTTEVMCILMSNSLLEQAILFVLDMEVEGRVLHRYHLTVFLLCLDSLHEESQE